MTTNCWKRLPALAGCLVASCCIAACGKNEPKEPKTGAAYPDSVVVDRVPEQAAATARLDGIEQRHFAVYTNYVAVADAFDDASPASVEPKTPRLAYFCAADADR